MHLKDELIVILLTATVLMGLQWNLSNCCVCSISKVKACGPAIHSKISGSQ